MALDRVPNIIYLFPPAAAWASRDSSATPAICRCITASLLYLRPGIPLPRHSIRSGEEVSPDTEIFRAFNPGISYGTQDRLWKRILDGTAGDQTAPRHKSQPPLEGARQTIEPPEAFRANEWKTIPPHPRQRFCVVRPSSKARNLPARASASSRRETPGRRLRARNLVRSQRPIPPDHARRAKA